MKTWTNGHIQLSVQQTPAGWIVAEWRWDGHRWNKTGRGWRFDDLDSAARFIKSYLF